MILLLFLSTFSLDALHTCRIPASVSCEYTISFLGIYSETTYGVRRVCKTGGSCDCTTTWCGDNAVSTVCNLSNEQ